MAVTLIVEDGSIVGGANTFVDVNGAREFAACRGLVLAADDDVLKQHLIRSMDYIESRRCDLQGCKADVNQALQFPRKGFTYEGREIPDPEDGDPWFMPKELVGIQTQLAIEINAGTPLYPIGPNTDSNFQGGPIIEETIGPLTVRYSDKHVVADGINGSRGEPNIIPSVEPLLEPLLESSCGQNFSVVRV